MRHFGVNDLLSSAAETHRFERLSMTAYALPAQL